MASKYCSNCPYKQLLSSFLADPSNPRSKILSTCIKCRARDRARYKRKALQPLDSNAPSKRPATARTKPTEAPSIRPPQQNPPPDPLLNLLNLLRLLHPLLLSSPRASYRRINGG